MTHERYDRGLAITRNQTRSAIENSLKENDIHVIMGPADARIASVAAAAGYPVATVPLGFADFNGRAFGMNLIARENEEEKLLQVMSAWEKTFGPRKPPTLAHSQDDAEVSSTTAAMSKTSRKGSSIRVTRISARKIDEIVESCYNLIDKRQKTSSGGRRFSPPMTERAGTGTLTCLR